MRRSLLLCVLVLGLFVPSMANAQDLIHSKNAIQKLSDPKTRDAATQIFLHEGSRWLSKAPEVLGLYGADPGLNNSVVSILEKMGTGLISLLKNEIKTAKKLRLDCVLTVVEKLGSRGISLLPVLSEESQGKGIERRRRMLRAISFLSSERATPILRVALRDKNIKVALAAARGLGQLGRYGRGGVPALLAQLTEESSSVLIKAAIIESLGKIGLTHRAVAPTLLNALASDFSAVKGQALIALARNHWGAKTLKAPVLSALKQSDPMLRSGALKTLEVLGLQGHFAKEELESLFRQNRALRLPVFAAYIAVDRDSRFGIYELLAMFPRESAQFRARALELLAQAGPRNPVIVSELFKMAGSAKSLEVRKAAIRVLQTYPRFNEPKRTGFIIELIKNAPNSVVKIQGIKLYSRHAPKTAEARSFLIARLKNATPERTRALVKALLELGRGGKGWVFNEALRDGSLLSFEAAYQWLLSNGKIKKERRSAWTKQLVLGISSAADLKDWRRVSLGLKVMALLPWTDDTLAVVARRYLGDPRDNYRRCSFQFLSKNASLYQKDLLPGLKDPLRGIKREVALSFMELATPDKNLLKALETRLLDSDFGLEAAATLVNIGKGTLRRKARRQLELALGQADFRGLHLFQQLKDLASGSVAELAKGLPEVDPRHRRELTKALAYCKGTEAKTSLELLFNDPDSRVKAAAIDALVIQSGAKQNPSLEKALFPLLKGSSVPIKSATMRALGKIGSTKSKLALFEFKNSPNSELRRAAAEAVASLGKEAFAPLGLALSDRKTRAWGGMVIRNVDSEFAGDLTRHFKDHAFVVRRALCQALGEGSQEIYPKLLPLLRKDDSAAKLAWEIFGEHGEDAIDCLIDEVRKGHEQGLASAGEALKIIGPASVPPLLKLMRDKNVKLRRNGVRALGIVGSVNPRVGTALLAALEDKDLRVRAEAAGGLGNCVLAEQRPLIVSGLIRALNDSSRKIRVRAVMSFGRLGERVADIAIPELKKTLKSWDKDIRRESLRALASMGSKRFSCLGDIIGALKDKDASVRRAAIETLSEFGKEGKAALKELEKVATVDSDVPARLAAAQAIESIKEAIEKKPLEKK